MIQFKIFVTLTVIKNLVLFSKLYIVKDSQGFFIVSPRANEVVVKYSIRTQILKFTKNVDCFIYARQSLTLMSKHIVQRGAGLG